MIEPHGESAILYVDLSNREVRKESKKDLKRLFLGGWGGNAKLIYDLWKPEAEAYSPENPIVLGAGLLSGTLCPGASKSFLTTRCPSSGTVSTAVGSLDFGAGMHWAGYDHIVITDRANRPVYITVFDDEIEMHDAGELWGKSVPEATDMLYDKYNGLKFPISIAAIGPSGENLVNISMVYINKLSTFGRTNGGSFGSKNLKAVLVGGKKGIKPFDKKGFMKIVGPLVKEAWDDPNRKGWANLGLYYVFEFWLKGGYFVKGNWEELFPDEEAMKLYGVEEYLKYKRSSISCTSCLACDKAIMRIAEGEKKGMEYPLSTTIDPAMFFGMRLQVGSMEKAQRCVALCNELGIDFATFSGMLIWLIDIYKGGTISKDDTDGIDLSKPDFNTIMHLIELTSQNQGFGRVLAEGYTKAEERIGRNSGEHVCHIKGTEPDIDARASLGVETFGSVVNPRGAHDMPVGGLMLAQGRKPEFLKKVARKMGFTEAKLEETFHDDTFDLGKFQVYYENWATLLNCMGICFRMQCSRLYTPESIAGLVTSLTGLEITPKELLESAERAYNVYKVVNVKAGFSRKDDRFPDVWFKPLKAPERGEEYVLRDYFDKKVITREHAEKLLDDYYIERGWDVNKGIPAKEKLTELGLSDVAEDLAGY